MRRENCTSLLRGKPGTRSDDHHLLPEPQPDDVDEAITSSARSSSPRSTYSNLATTPPNRISAAYLDAEDATLRRYAHETEVRAKYPSDHLGLMIDAIATDAVRYHDRGCPFINAAAEFPDARRNLGSKVRPSVTLGANRPKNREEPSRRPHRIRPLLER